MLPYRDSRITRAALGLFFVLIVVYAYFEARGILYGPAIHVPEDATEVRDPFVTISGHAERIAELSMNGRPISVTEAGEFTEPYVLAPGLNRIMLDATDRYGRKTQKIVQIVYIPDPDAPQPSAATSTPQPATTTATTSVDTL